MRAFRPALVGALALSRLGGSAFAEDAWCPDLARLVDLAATNKLAYIAGPPREGSFRDTSIRLAGWRDCSLYGARTYTCELQGFETSGQAETALASFVTAAIACLGEAWSRDDSRSSPVYVVVRSRRDPVSMTLSTDQIDGAYVVRLTLFWRGR